MKQKPEEQEPALEEWKQKPVKKQIDKSIPEGCLLKVELCGIEPAIWRSFTVPADITLSDLHALLQIVMGWTNSHLHAFRDGENCYGPFDEELEEQIDENSVLLSDIFRKKGSTLTYDYDFGDGWEHQITCKDVMSKVPEIAVIDGKRACPPDDCGGIPGYDQILKTLSDPNHEGYDGLMDWLGEDYDPKFFDTEPINRALNQFSVNNS